MIIKSVSHAYQYNKRTRIKKLLVYVHDNNKMKDTEGKICMVKRFINGYGNLDTWAQQFVENDNNRTFEHKKRVIIRHEIFSFSPKSTPIITREALQNITKEYLINRTESPAVAVAHFEEGKPIHVHCVIGAVRIDTGKSTRVSKQKFKEFKIGMEDYIKEHYPDIHRTSYIDHDKGKQPP